MLRIVLVDDQKSTLEILAANIEQWPGVEIVGKFLKPSEAIANIALLKPDAVYLDIEMPEMNGIECAMKITEQDNQVAIVFVTAYDSFALEAFNLNALHYLIKPIDSKKLENSIQRIYKFKGLIGEERAHSRVLVRINMLGGFEVVKGDRVSIRWVTAKAEELFAYLLLHNCVASKWDIIESMWPNTELQKAEQNLYTTIFRLKQSLREQGLGFGIEAVQKIYKLSFHEAVDWDVENLSNALSSEDERSLQKALRLYKGELLAGKDYLWCYPKRLEISTNYQNVANKLIQILFREGRYREAFDILEKVLKHGYLEEGILEKLEVLTKLKLDRRLQKHLDRIINSCISIDTNEKELY